MGLDFSSKSLTLAGLFDDEQGGHGGILSSARGRRRKGLSSSLKLHRDQGRASTCSPFRTAPKALEPKARRPRTRIRDPNLSPIALPLETNCRSLAASSAVRSVFRSAHAYSTHPRSSRVDGSSLPRLSAMSRSSIELAPRVLDRLAGPRGSSRDCPPTNPPFNACNAFQRRTDRPRIHGIDYGPILFTYKLHVLADYIASPKPLASEVL